MRFLILTAALALGSACSRDSAAPSSQQNREMDEAAELLNDAPNRLANIDDSELTAPAEANETRP